MKITSYTTIIVSALFISLALLSCSNHSFTAKPVASNSQYPKALERAQKKHWYMFMQSGLNQYTIAYVDLDQAKQQMTVTLNKVDSLQLLNATNIANNLTQKGQSAKRQLRVYMSDSTSYTLDEPHTISLTKVARMETVD